MKKNNFCDSTEYIFGICEFIFKNNTVAHYILFQTMLCNWIICRLCKLLIMFINLNMKLVMHYSEKAESAFKASLRKISSALKAERDVGNRRGRWGAGPSHFFANQIPYLKKGSRLCPQYYCSPPLDFQTFRHLYLFSHGYRS